MRKFHADKPAICDKRPFRTELRADNAALNDRLSQLGFGAARILAAGLIALVTTQLQVVGASPR